MRAPKKLLTRFLHSQVIFELVYDELLKMTNQQYTHDIKVNLNEEVQDLKFDVLINETISIRQCDVIRNGLLRNFEWLDRADRFGEEVCHVVYTPSRVGVGAGWDKLHNPANRVWRILLIYDDFW